MRFERDAGPPGLVVDGLSTQNHTNSSSRDLLTQ